MSFEQMDKTDMVFVGVCGCVLTAMMSVGADVSLQTNMAALMIGYVLASSRARRKQRLEEG